MTLAPFPTAYSRARLVGAALLLAASIGAVPTVAGAQSSPSYKGAHADVRLIAGEARQAAGVPVLRAGLDIKLAPGWKTYWRYPGDSGVAPRFDFSASENVAALSVMWPAPMRFSDGSGFSIGYADRIIFPLHIVPAQANARMVLRLKLDYAVCEKLCVPDAAHLALALPSPAVAQDEAALQSSEARVPLRTALAAPGSLSVVAVSHQPGTPGRVLVDVRTPEGASVDLFAEGPTAAWSLPLPEPATGAPNGLRRFAFALEGLPPGATVHGAALTLTAVTATDAIEVVVHLD
jgi:DsbC/DsbD-like thiol-disulfide interchange protein